MSTRRTPATVAAVAALTLVSGPAWAGGSDDPTPYTVDAAGITLPAPLEAHGHINIRTTGGESFGIHLDPNNGHPGGAWIGESFVPWSAFSDAPLCVEWVQVGAYNEHYGEGGQAPVGAGCVTPEPDPGPTESPEPAPTPDPAPEPEQTPEPEPEPTDTPTDTPTPDPTATPEPEPDPVIPPKPEPRYWGDRVTNCETRRTTVTDYRADWVWDGTEWVLGVEVPVGETTVQAGDECAPTPTPDGEQEQVGGTPEPTPTVTTTPPADDTAPASGQLAETGLSGSQVAAAIAISLAGILAGASLVLAVKAGRK